MAAAALANRPVEYRLHPGVCPSWDNEARQPSRGFSFYGATPAAYHDGPAAACEHTLDIPDPSERIVFINAWNEWAEGVHLEPDRHHGYAYLAETARVVARLCGHELAAPRPPASPLMPPAKRPSRPVISLPRLIVKNLAFHAANMADGAARVLRKLV